MEKIHTPPLMIGFVAVLLGAMLGAPPAVIAETNQWPATKAGEPTPNIAST